MKSKKIRFPNKLYKEIKTEACIKGKSFDSIVIGTLKFHYRWVSDFVRLPDEDKDKILGLIQKSREME